MIVHLFLKNENETEILEKFLSYIQKEIKVQIHKDEADLMRAITDDIEQTIITDLVDINKNNFAIIDTVKEKNEKISIIVLYASLTENEILHLINYSKIHFLEKPYDIETIELAINTANSPSESDVNFERRDFIRIPSEQIKTAKINKGRTFEVKNISLSGVLLTSEAEIQAPAGFVEITLENKHYEIPPIKGRVIKTFANPPGRTIAIEFTELPDKLYQILKNEIIKFAYSSKRIIWK